MLVEQPSSSLRSPLLLHPSEIPLGGMARRWRDSRQDEEDDDVEILATSPAPWPLRQREQRPAGLAASAGKLPARLHSPPEPPRSRGWLSPNAQFADLSSEAPPMPPLHLGDDNRSGYQSPFPAGSVQTSTGMYPSLPTHQLLQLPVESADELLQLPVESADEIPFSRRVSPLERVFGEDYQDDGVPARPTESNGPYVGPVAETPPMPGTVPFQDWRRPQLWPSAGMPVTPATCINAGNAAPMYSMQYHRVPMAPASIASPHPPPFPASSMPEVPPEVSSVSQGSSAENMGGSVSPWRRLEDLMTAAGASDELKSSMSELMKEVERQTKKPPPGTRRRGRPPKRRPELVRPPLPYDFMIPIPRKQPEPLRRVETPGDDATKLELQGRLNSAPDLPVSSPDPANLTVVISSSSSTQGDDAGELPVSPRISSPGREAIDDHADYLPSEGERPASAPVESVRGRRRKPKQKLPKAPRGRPKRLSSAGPLLGDTSAAAPIWKVRVKPMSPVSKMIVEALKETAIAMCEDE